MSLYIKKGKNMKKIALILTLLASFANADKIVKLDITGMMCPACVSNVKNSINSINGVKNTDVFLKSQKAEVTTDNATKPEDLCAVVVKAGYGCKVAK
jgi:copper chaperone CopZ